MTDTRPPAEKSAGPDREEMIARLKREFDLSLLYLSPRLDKDLPAIRGKPISAHTDADRKALLETGLWKKNEDGEIGPPPDHLDLGDLDLEEHTALSLALIARLSEDGPCWYESSFVATNQKLKKEFYRKIKQAFKELIEQSAQEPADTVMAWSHGALDCVQNLQRSPSKGPSK